MTGFRSLGTERQPITAYGFTGLAPLSPAYRLSGGQLIAATSPDLLAQALDAAARHRSFVDEPRFAVMTQRLPDRSHIGFLGETSRIADFLQTHVRCAVPPGPPESPFETLLDLSRATDLPPTAATVRMTQGGLLIDWISPVSPSFILSLCLASDAGDPARPADGQASTLEGEIPY